MKLLPSIALACGGVAAAEVVVNRVADDFRWADPFGGNPAPPGFEAACEATRTFKARQHPLSELQQPEPTGLQPWSKALRYFFGGRPFPGSWDGVDAHGTKRNVIHMEYVNLPGAVKYWIEEKRLAKDDAMYLYGVYHKDLPGIKIKGTATPRPRRTATASPPSSGEGGEGKEGQEAVDAEAARLPPDENLVVLFAAGAVYHNLPLWVAEGSECEAELRDLARYSAEPKDGGVVGWVVERTEPDLASNSREMEFKVKAQVLRETEQGRTARLAREKDEAEAKAQAQTHGQGQQASSEAATEPSAASDKDEL